MTEPRRFFAAGRVLLAAGLLAAGLGVSACTTARNTLGTNTSPCFRALGVALDAVNSKGRLGGVRYFTVGDLDVQLRHTKARHRDLAPHSVGRRSGVCVVAYTGHFDAADVKHGWAPGRGSGDLALVVVRLRDDRVLATIVLDHAPWRLARVFPTR